MARAKPVLPSGAAIMALADAQGRLAIRVTPGAAAEAIALPATGNILVIRTVAPPADGKANDAVLRLLAKALDRPVSTVELVRGAASRNRTVRLTT